MEENVYQVEVTKTQEAVSVVMITQRLFAAGAAALKTTLEKAHVLGLWFRAACPTGRRMHGHTVSV